MRRIVALVREHENRPPPRDPPPSLPPPVEGSAFIGKLEESLSFEGEADMEVWAGIPLASSGIIFKCHDWFLVSGQTIDSGMKVYVRWFSGRLYVLGAGCAIPSE